MPSSFPAGLDDGSDLPEPSDSTEMNAAGFEHGALHTTLSQAVLALEAKVGADGSAIRTSLDFKVGAAWTIPTGLVADGATDNSAAIQAALDAANAAGGGTVLIPPGVYAFATPLDLEGFVNVRLLGAGTSMAAGAATAGATRLKYTGTTSPAINCGSSFGVHLEHLGIFHSNASFTGHQVSFANTASGDAAFWAVKHCGFGAYVGAGIASCSLYLDQAIIGIVEGCNFDGLDGVSTGKVAWAIIGNDGGGYSNNITVRNCEFLRQTTGAILDPAQQWTIEGCDFNAKSDGKANPVRISATRNASALIYRGNWCGDVSVAGESWLDFDAMNSLFGLVVEGNYFGAAQTGGYAMTASSNVRGWAFLGNSCNGPGGINFASSVSQGFVIIGNDFTACGTTGLVNFPGSSVDYFVAGNYDLDNSLKFGIHKLGVGNSAAASGPVGSVVKKIEVFDVAGTSLGFIPVYNSIT